jgi:2'-5' RNA ligase
MPVWLQQRAQCSVAHVFGVQVVIESALVFLVPEAEALVGPFRDRHDPAAAAGMPAHITLLYPFKQPAEIDASVLDGLRQCFAPLARFPFVLAEVRRFDAPDAVLYLAPEPAEPFRALTLAIWQRWPEPPPYGGRHAEIIPHLCVAQVADLQQLDTVARRFAPKAAAMLPIRAIAAEVALMDTRSGRWQIRTTFSLGRMAGSND